MEEMEKRSRRRTRDLVTQAASQGLSENEIGCARISMMARSTNAPCKGRIQMRKTNPLHLLTFGLHRTAGPYGWGKKRRFTRRRVTSGLPDKRTFSGSVGWFKNAITGSWRAKAEGKGCFYPRGEGV